MSNSQDLDEVVSRDPEVHSGDLVFSHTRVPVDILIAYLKRGASIEEFLDNYPSVQRRQVENLLELTPTAVDRLRQRESAA